MTSISGQTFRGSFIHWKNSHSSWRVPIITGTLVFLGLRLWSSLVLLLLQIFPPQVVPSDGTVRESLFWLENSRLFSRLFLSPWFRWDTVYYLEIAQDGYTRPFLSVWPPLYPAVIRLVSSLGISPLVSAILVGNLCAILTFILLFRVSEELFPGWGASTIRNLALFPTAFFLVAAYSESTFLVLAIACLWKAHQGNFRWAGFWATLAALTRLQGVMLVIPLFIEFWEHQKTGIKRENDSGAVFHGLMDGVLLLLPVMATAGFVLYVKLDLGFDWPWETLGSAWGQHTGLFWEGAVGNLTSLLGVRQIATPINPLARITDLVLVAFSLACLIIIAEKRLAVPVSFQIYAWLGMLLLLVKVDNQSLLVSSSRYVLSLFPIFFSMNSLFPRHLGRLGNLLVLSLGLISQAILLVCFSWWIWVA